MSNAKKIVRRCNGHPLLIAAIGEMLSSRQDWQSFYKEDFSRSEPFVHVLALLKLSYDRLPSPLLLCFAYCSLFLKDHEFDVLILVQLWMAQGFIDPQTTKNQSLEDVGYACFMHLLDRNFFLQVKADDKEQRVTKCKMNDLMHDLATYVAGEQSLLSYSPREQASASLINPAKIGFIHLQSNSWRAEKARVANGILDAIISGCRYLRVVDMHALGISVVPSSIGKLKRLRYLDLSENEDIIEHSDSITELQNLQTLRLSSCFELRRLPRDIGNLINLRHLEIDVCYNLVSLPRGITRLTNLETLSRVVLSEDASTHTDQLEQLRRPNNFRGEVEIRNMAEIYRNSIGAFSLRYWYWLRLQIWNVLGRDLLHDRRLSFRVYKNSGSLNCPSYKDGGKLVHWRIQKRAAYQYLMVESW
ncbi:hypothetical protein TIFTF001_022730 [Ficus carica]|uniref:NB-ARC domain-containing protein n=1 Tax=Ficus carica TaxID=3494 RepID=A0AA88DD24_FICCA|nr:hypothetical protein TIFTF001_022730 [Ficus carica]